jgi:GT2 family glycosyltransferase
MRAITVVIPVYNAFDVTLDCIQSVISTIPKGIKVCVIDDASPAGELRDVLPTSIKRHPQVKVLRNDVNLGFVGTCNRGMLIEAANDDVILLNSDTIVTPGWIDKMRRAAYSRPNIGTVTPLTNNGTICSSPLFLENNPIPRGFSLTEFADLVERLSEREYVELPTCVGFCVYIRRKMLDQVGVFDPVFKQGYGEENDLSMRATQAGFASIVDDATYIYHRGNMSFKEMRESLSEVNSEILRRRYPDYGPSVGRFCAANPLARVHDRIWNALVPRWIDSRKRVVLHIAHNGPFVARRHGLGGTESHIQSIIKHDKDSAHHSLTPGDGCLYLTAHTDLGDRTLVIPHALLPAILRREFFDVIHLHHSKGFDVQALADALVDHGNYIVSIHDYHLICSRLWLFRPDSKACDGTSCGGSCGEPEGSGAARRAVAKKVLAMASRIIVFSQSSRRLISELLGDFSQIEVHNHGIDTSVRRNLVLAPTKPGDDRPLKVVCVGSFTPHKGSGLISQAVTEIKSVAGATFQVAVDWYFLGREAEGVPGLSNRGEFTPLNVAEKISEIGAHVALLAPQCHETYSLTLDELVWSGIPVIVSPYGALPERVIGWGVGYVFNNSIDDLGRTLAEIVNDWDRHEELFTRTSAAEICSLEQEVQGYSSIYSALVTSGCAVSSNALVSYLQPDLCESPQLNPVQIINNARRHIGDYVRSLLAEAETCVRC